MGFLASISSRLEKSVISIMNVLLHLVYLITYPVFRWLNRFNDPLPPVKKSEATILMASGTELANMIRQKKVSCEEVVQCFKQRLEAVTPVINAVVCDRFNEALMEARMLDEQLLNLKEIPPEYCAEQKPFLGVPFTIKEAFAIKGMPNTSGLLSRKHCVANKDADVVVKMREAGAIPIAVTNCSELCMWYESSNLLYGRCRNPYHTGHIAGGSSGGEGANQASAGAPVGVGSDIGGSIRMPAFFNGIFGHKATTGTVNNNGQWPMALQEGETFLSTGPMCRYAQDLLPMFRTLAKESYLEMLKLDQQVDLSKLRVFYKCDDGGGSLCSPVHQDIKQCIMKASQHLSSNSSESAREYQSNKLRLSLQIWSCMMSTCGNNKFCAEMGNLERSVRPLWELVCWMTGRPRHTLPAILLGLVEKLPMPAPAVTKLRKIHDKLKEELVELLGEDGVLLYPTHPLPAPMHNQPLLLSGNFAYTGIFNTLGLPCTAVPMGLTKEGLPIGLQVVGAPYMDRLTIAVAGELERAFGGWVPPFQVE